MPTGTSILFILADDHGWGDVSMHGGPDIRTPHIDRIAADGIRFSHMYANSTVCSPSRAALLTGRYPDMVGVPGVIRSDGTDSWGYFDPAAVTLAEMLGRSGYHTCHLGKWHLGLEPENHPCRRGFQRYRGFLGDMMDDYWTHRRCGRNLMFDDRREIDPAGHATDIFTDWAVEYLRARAAAAEPFFLYLAYNAPHDPIQPPPGWKERVQARAPGLSEKRARYIALVEHLDTSIGRVLDTLDQTGLARDTLVVYASDNGGWLPAGADNGPWRGGKCDMYEGGLRVPCCLRWPGRVAPGRTVGQMAMLMDFFPTLCEVAGAPVGHAVDGRSLVDLLDGRPVDFADRRYYWVRREGGNRYCGGDYHAARHGDLKLLHNDVFSPLELYDLAADPAEARDLGGDGHPAAQGLRRYLQERIRQAGAVPWQPPPSAAGGPPAADGR